MKTTLLTLLFIFSTNLSHALTYQKLTSDEKRFILAALSVAKDGSDPKIYRYLLDYASNDKIVSAKDIETFGTARRDGNSFDAFYLSNFLQKLDHIIFSKESLSSGLQMYSHTFSTSSPSGRPLSPNNLKILKTDRTSILIQIAGSLVHEVAHIVQKKDNSVRGFLNRTGQNLYNIFHSFGELCRNLPLTRKINQMLYDSVSGGAKINRGQIDIQEMDAYMKEMEFYETLSMKTKYKDHQEVFRSVYSEALQNYIFFSGLDPDKYQHLY